MARVDSSSGDESDAPSLDPVPQELTATIEARFTATGVSLGDPADRAARAERRARYCAG